MNGWPFAVVNLWAVSPSNTACGIKLHRDGRSNNRKLSRQAGIFILRQLRDIILVIECTDVTHHHRLMMTISDMLALPPATISRRRSASLFPHVSGRRRILILKVLIYFSSSLRYYNSQNYENSLEVFCEMIIAGEPTASERGRSINIHR